jgi:hypothetical protein
MQLQYHVFCRTNIFDILSNKIAKYNIQTTPHQVQSVESNARSKILQISGNALEIGMAVAYN